MTSDLKDKFNTHYAFQVTLGFAIGTYAPPAYGKYIYPHWAVIMGWLIAAASLVPIPVYMIYKMYSTPGTLEEVNSLAISHKQQMFNLT